MSEYAVTIHEPSQVHATVLLGDQTVIWPYTTILEGVQLGKRCVIGTCGFIGRRCVIGDDAHFHSGVQLPNEAVIGNRVYLGPNVVLTNDAYPYVAGSSPVQVAPIVGDDVVIGANAVILPGVRIGKGALVGAGAVVTRDVAPGMVVVGNPARVLVKAGNIGG